VKRIALPLKARSLPGPGHAEVWLTDLTALPIDFSEPRHTRRQALARRRLRQQFILRLLLGAYLGCPGKDVELVRTARGKPVLAGRWANSPLAFSVSNADEWLAVAVARGAAVGVDIEIQRPLPRAVRLARRFLSAPEAEWLNTLDEPLRSRQFLRQWTAREALVKAQGSALAVSLGALELDWQPARIRRLPRDWPGTGRWTLSPLLLPARLIGSLALDQPDHRAELLWLTVDLGRD